MNTPMNNAIVEYLACHPQGARAEEIVRDVLKMTNVPSETAQHLVHQLLNGDPHVYQKDQRWCLKLKVREPNDWMLCKLFPATAQLPQIRTITVAACRNAVVQPAETYDEISPALLSFIGDSPLLFDGIGNQISNFRRGSSAFTLFENPVISLSRIVKKLFPDETIHSGLDLSRILGVSLFDDADPEVQFHMFVEQVEQVLKLLEAQGLSSVDEIEAFAAPDAVIPDYERYRFDAEFIQTLPQTPGVYVMKDKQNEVVYVGKAKNLARRVKSYFQHSEHLDDKVLHIREVIYDIDITETGNELAALLLEYELIQRYQPPINQQVGVHPRTVLQHERYPRIAILPAHPEHQVELFLLNPGRNLQRHIVNTTQPDMAAIKKSVHSVFFQDIADVSDYEELVLSWLSQQSSVRNVDMRLYGSIDEVLRILKDHFQTMSDEPVIHY